MADPAQPTAAAGLHAALFGDPQTQAQFDGAAEIAAMVEVERALARAQGALGLIPATAAAAVEAGLAALARDGALPSPASLAAGTVAAGVPVPALVAALRGALPREAADALHFGATSQDIVDTALMLRLDRVLALHEGRLAGTVATLASLARAHRATPMAGRTRTQGATPISFGLRVATWALPLARALAELRRLRRDGLPVQLGGASGDLAALAERAGPDGAGRVAALAERLAQELGLAPALPWMTDRTPVARVAGLWAAIATGLEKMAADCLLATRAEIGEIRLAETGGSSTMPQKQNPVRAEAVVALARHARGLAGLLAGAPAQIEERDGAGWMGEWLALPPLAAAAGACLLQADALAGGLTPVAERLAAHAARDGGSLLAERLSFALIPLAGRAGAQALVKEAAALARDPDGPGAAAAGPSLVDRLRPLVRRAHGAAADGLDWDALASFETAAASAAAMTDRMLAEIGRLAG